MRKSTRIHNNWYRNEAATAFCHEKVYRQSWTIMEVVNRLAIFPTFSSYTSVKCRLTCARRGRDLLEKKVDGLLIRFRAILLHLLENKLQLGEVMKNAAFSLAEVNYATGGVNKLVLQTVNKAKIKIRSRQEIIGGIRLQIYEPFCSSTDPFELAGLARGGQQVIIMLLLTASIMLYISS